MPFEVFFCLFSQGFQIVAFRFPSMFFGFGRIGVPVAFYDTFDTIFKFRALFFKIFPGAAPFFRGIGWQFAAIYGKHLFSDHPHLITDKQHFTEQVQGFLVTAGDKGCNGCEIGLAVMGKSDKYNIFLTASGNFPAGRYPSGVSEQHDLEQNFRIVGRGSGFIIVVSVFKRGKIQLVIDNMVDGKFEGSGLKLAIKID